LTPPDVYVLCLFLGITESGNDLKSYFPDYH
jgi:hypothetical protein